jgi:DNA-binding NarL/FixJ family response regulator
MVKGRGFSEEGLTDVALLLVEEVGELVKAIRLQTGLKVGEGDLERRKSIELELADCLVYLLDLVILADINLEDALREKDALNARKKWARLLPMSWAPLSPREMEILQHVSLGYTNKEIAKRLGLAEKTVKSHVASVLRKLSLNDSTQVDISAIRRVETTS